MVAAPLAVAAWEEVAQAAVGEEARMVLGMVGAEVGTAAVVQGEATTVAVP